MQTLIWDMEREGYRAGVVLFGEPGWSLLLRTEQRSHSGAKLLLGLCRAVFWVVPVVNGAEIGRFLPLKHHRMGEMFSWGEMH